jgi:hypothetical protein
MRANRSIRPDSDSPEVNRDGPTTARPRGETARRRTPGQTSAEHPAAPFETDGETAGRPARPPEIEKALAPQRPRVPSSVDPGANPMFAATALIIIAAVVLAVLVGALFMSMQSG